jgi:hypothetical protein
MADSHTVVSSSSWFSRIGKSIMGVLVGLVLLVVAVVLLFWNEGRAVKTFKTLQEGEGAVVSVEAGEINPDNEGKLIHLSGAAETEETLTDPSFGVSENALRLQRSVSMYQWEEKSESKTEKKLGGGEETVTTYTYSKGWSEGLIDSSSFNVPDGHENPSELPFESLTWDAEIVQVGAFTLSADLVSMLSGFEELPIKQLPEGIDWPEDVKPDKGKIYLGANPAQPQIGDVRVAFSVVPPGEVSLLAGQSGDSFQAYRTKAGGTIEIIKSGRHDARAMFAAAHADNTLLTWILRVVGFFLIWIGFSLVLAPLSVLADVVPFFGNLVGAVTGFVTFLLALALSALVIAVAWIFFRPLLAIFLFAVAGAAVFFLCKVLRKKAGPIPAAA